MDEEPSTSDGETVSDTLPVQWRSLSPTIVCKKCGKEVPRKSIAHLYCEECSNEINANRIPHRDPPRRTGASLEREAKLQERGLEENRECARGIGWPEQPQLEWLIRVAVPFDYSHSKNRIYSNDKRRFGHVVLRRETVAARDSIIWAVKSALRGVEVAQRKTWLDILVQKPNHRGDAVNVVDTVCDAVKQAIQVDDRWFSIRMLDWEIVRENPRLFIGIGQEAGLATRICSACGQPRTFSEFTKNVYDKLFGTSRVCRKCSTAGKES